MRFVGAPMLTLALIIGAVSASATAAQTPSRLERDVLRELNQARTGPEAYVPRLVAYRRGFAGSIAHEPGSEVGVRTFEGPGAVDEAIAFLSHQRPLGPIEADPALARAAAEHADEQARTGGFGHGGADGSQPSQRVWRYARGRMLVAEVISYGQASAEGVIRQLIVDDGQPTRGHRAILFSAPYRRAGVACRPHPVYGHSCVIDLTN